ncbi:hypothetical protein CRENBAI_014331 [Crenichthys baileyi]|uniref:Uncharacterized protein n=1 Tax=Crenichthys baileyi TaxID=28760 RepID=A0AAV9SBQ0_9TELE
MKANNEHHYNLSTLYEQRTELELRINDRKKKMGRQQFQDPRRPGRDPAAPGAGKKPITAG